MDDEHQAQSIKDTAQCVDALTAALEATDEELYTVNVHLLRLIAEFVPYGTVVQPCAPSAVNSGRLGHPSPPSRPDPSIQAHRVAQIYIQALACLARSTLFGRRA